MIGADICSPVCVGGDRKLESRVKGRHKSEKSSAEKRLVKQLVRQVKRGEVAAFRELVELYEARAHAIALGVIGNREDAEDIVQDAFLKAYKNINSFRGTSSFYTWLYRIIFNLSIDYTRKRYRTAESSVGDQATLDVSLQRASAGVHELLGSTSSPDIALERQELQIQIRAAIDKLSPEHRAVILLREFDGLSYNEISDVVGISKGTVMSRLHHARKRLQKTLSNYLSFQGSSSSEPIEQLQSNLVEIEHSS